MNSLRQKYRRHRPYASTPWALLPLRYNNAP